MEIGPLAAVEQDFFYYDPGDDASHSLLFFYQCRPKTFDLHADGEVDDGEATHPHWVDVAALRPEQFIGFGELIIELAGQQS